MSLTTIHAGLSNTAVLFVAAIGLWALVLRFMSRPLDSSWYGAAMIAEILLLAQAVIGAVLYFEGFEAALARPFMHLLYGVVAVVTLPAAWSYFGHLEDDRVKTVAMAVTCFFLWGILLRAGNVARFPLPGA